jgi:hypothetical protein
MAPGRLVRAARTVRAFSRGRDLALGYALVLLGLAVFLALVPDRVHDDLVLRSSTNLANLRDDPLVVLLVSAFVLPSSLSLWVLPVLVAAYGAAQRWLGRTATLLVALVGHVFATVFVAVLLAAGIAHHQLDRAVAREPDVGASYGLAAVLAVLVYRLPPLPRRCLALGGTVALTVLVLVSETFTDLGHLTAWLIGLAMGQVGAASSRAAARCPAQP